jgi:predicted MFS family arabinose efflux permease
MSFIACILIRPTTMMVYAMTVFDSIAASLFEPLRKTSIPLVVGKMQIPAANGLENISSSSTMILGPVVGAELFVRSGLTIALAIDAISYLMSAWLINGARIPQTESSSEFAPTRLKEELINGWRYAVEHDFIARIATLLFVSIICGGLWFPLAPFFVRDVLETGPALVGWQISVFGLGGIAGGLLAPRLSKHFELLRILHWSCLLEAFAMIVYSLVRSPASSTLMIFFWGILVSVIGVCSHSILQARVNEQYLGKVFSFLKQAENSAMLLSMLAAVSLTSIISIPHLFFVSGLSYCVVVGISRSRRGAPASVA